MNLDKADLSFLGMSSEKGDLRNALGDLVEKELFLELKKFYKDKKVVVFWGLKLKVPRKKGGNQEFDFVIIDQELKTIIGIESKATLSFRTGKDAAAQTQRLKEVLEQYFEAELAGSDWCFVAMVHFNKLDLRQPICTSCSPFTIHEAKTLATKLADVETHLKAVRPMWSSSHQEYVALAEGLSFVFSSAPISTRCTITSDVYAKVVGKPETSSSKAKVGQGDFKSIIFYTNE